MDILEKIAVGLTVSIVAALLFYAFKVRQLYILIPKMLSYSPFTDRGKVSELRVLNRGRAMEEDVHVTMPPALSYELVAADHADVKLEANKLSISRIPPFSEVAIILLVEGPIATEKFEPEVSSKTTKGKPVKNIESVPPNAGRVVLRLVTYLAVITFTITGLNWFFDYQGGRYKMLAHERFGSLEAQGWDDFSLYMSSDTQASYAPKEFPFGIVSSKVVGNMLELTFSATNKTTTTLNANAYFTSVDDKPGKEKTVRGDGVFGVSAAPMQAVTLRVTAALEDLSDAVYVHVYFDAEDHMAGASFFPLRNAEIRDVIARKPQNQPAASDVSK